METSNKPTLVILAAGMGSRYGSLKQLDAFGPSGETLLEYSIYDAIKAGFGQVVFIIRKQLEEEFKSFYLPKFADQVNVDFVFQELDAIPAGCTLPEGRVKTLGDRTRRIDGR